MIVNNEINISIDSCIELCEDDRNSITVVIVIQGCLGVVCSDIEVPVIVYNPCLDVNFFGIMPTSVPDITCDLYGEGCTWEHQTFIIISSSTTIFDMCQVAYTIDAGDLDIYISYDVDLHIIIFYCEDMDLLVNVNYSYTITVSVNGLTGQCGICAGCCGSSTGIITIGNPCLTPVITIGVVINIDFSFNGPTTWNPPPCVVTPPVCYQYLTYTCTYFSGPYTGPIDLCNFVSISNVVIDINFNFDSGVFVFDTDDTSTFPAGLYTFVITYTIG